MQGNHYERYYKRKKESLQKQLGDTGYRDLSMQQQTTGRQFRQAMTDTESSMKRQGVPLAQRAEVMRQTAQGYNQASSQAFQQARSEEEKRNRSLYAEMDEVNAQLDAIQGQKDNQLKTMLIQGASTAVGAGVGYLAGDPMMGAQFGASVGQTIGGVATEDYGSAMMGFGNTLVGISDAMELTSMKNEQKQLSEIYTNIAGKDGASPFEITERLQQLREFYQMGGDLSKFNIGE